MKFDIALLGKDDAKVTFKDKEENRVNRIGKNKREVIYALFQYKSFTGFSFDTNFTLKFSRYKDVYYKDKKLPSEIKLMILTDWWFDSRKDWFRKVESFNNYNAVEPEEPVQAFELAMLRWSDGADVKNMEMNEEYMSIIFENGKSISVLCESDEDYAWIIEGNTAYSDDPKWSVVCEDKEIYVEIK